MTEAEAVPELAPQPGPAGPAELPPAVRSAHAAAVARGDAGYLDPVSGLFTFTACYLSDRGTCCGNGCRHCPYQRPERDD